MPEISRFYGIIITIKLGLCSHGMRFISMNLRKTGLIYFGDGKIRLYDTNPLIEKGGIFELLRDKDFFKNRCTIINNTLAWDVNRGEVA